MPQVWQFVLCMALLQGAVFAADFTAAQASVARDGLQEALDQYVTKSFGATEDLDLPPYIQLSQRTIALVEVVTRKEANNVKLNKVSSLRRAGTLGLDPIVAGKTVNFTLPLQFDHPQLTGVFSRTVNDVGPSGNFTTTFGVLRLEVEGTATASPDACSFNFTSVKVVEVGGVDTVVEGASVLNSLLVSRVNKAIDARKLGVGEPLTQILLAKLQEGAKDCTAQVREHIKTVPATAA